MRDRAALLLVGLTALLTLPACGGGEPSLSTAARLALRHHADHATWQDLDPAHPGTRLLDPRTEVTFVRVPGDPDLLAARTELTVGQWRRYVRDFAGDASVPTPTDDELPMTLSWNDATRYCQTFGYRLPTGAEWERACRGGLDDDAGPWRNPTELQQHAWFNLNAGDDRHPVARLAANPFGLFDTLGNVWEWCQDEIGTDRMLRGGSWFTMPGPKPSLKTQAQPDERNAFYGFRPVR
ncbi:MAG: SUMF1/EgtB/PvdO family nonheme iron enzyme [Planctomycetes bacterium]|nr:SUMF1/EgtB/PvdO family nonheme iron enzyme [Planctomycetota bacterium]MCB9884560.1 SUMF1/EgtB/PvdO family nonheme iron enzyme [Planctomycetota bacterium]